MSNSYREFSFALGDVTPQEATWLRSAHNAKSANDESFCSAFCLVLTEGEACLFGEAEGPCDIEVTAEFIQRFLQKFRPKLTVGWEWADWCSKPLPGAFGGGVVLVSAKKILIDSTGEMLRRMLERRPRDMRAKRQKAA